MIQLSAAARIATAAPMITCTVIAVVPWKPNTQGETSVHNPTMRFSHSSQIAKAARAAIAMPAILAFSEAFPASNPNIQGEKNRHAPRIRLATSQNFALLQLSMAPSIEGHSIQPKSTKEPPPEFRLGLTIFNELRRA